MDNEVRYNPSGLKTIEIGTNSSDYTTNDWIGGVDDTDGYVIVTDTTSLGLAGAGSGGGVGSPLGDFKLVFYKSAGKTESDLLTLINQLPTSPGNFADLSSAIAWIDTSFFSIANYFSAATIISYDAGNPISYPGSGTVLYNLGTAGNVSGTIGTLYGVVYDSGTANGVFNFDGSSDYIDFSTFDFGTQMTVTAWVKPRSEFSINTLMATAYAGLSSDGFKLEWNNWQTSDLKMLIESGNGGNGDVLASVNPVITLDSWQFLTYVIDFTNASGALYHNAIQQATTGTIVNNITTNSNWNIGSMLGSYYMNADLGEFKIHNSVLTQSDIANEFNATRTRYGV